MSNNSIIEKIHPVIKIICIFIFIITTTLSNNIVGHTILLLSTFIFCYISNIKVEIYLKKIVQLKYFFLFIFLFNLIFKITLYDDIITILRLIEIILYTYMISYTTNLRYINDGLEKILNFFKIKSSILLLSITLSIQFIPIVLENTSKIIKAFKSKGINIKKNSLQNKIKMIKSIVIPIILSSIRHADRLSTIMELNLYDCNQKRSKYYTYKIHFYDFIYILFHFIILILILKEEIII